MEITRRQTKLLTAVLVTLSGLHLASGQATLPPEGVPGTIWTTTLQEAGSDYELDGAAVSPDDSATWLLVQKRPAGSLSTAPATVLLIEIDRRGKIVSTSDLTRALGAAGQVTPGDPTGFAAATQKELYLHLFGDVGSVGLIAF